MLHNKTTSNAAVEPALKNEAGPIPQDAELIRGRGSLPFKKRRLVFEPIPSWEQTPHCTENYKKADFVTPSPAYIGYCSHSDRRIATLALVAAASGRFPLALSNTRVESQGNYTAHPDQRLSHSQSDSSGSSTGSLVHIPTSLGPPPVTPTDTDAVRTLPDNITRRIHHPPLASPLPRGCHGRTSRNNSFCRRLPCYKGSIYCKLHFQQYVVIGTRSPAIATDGCLSEGTGQSEPRTPVPTSSTRQDKRYTGCDDEVRCQATTTRGRPCAYVSAGTSKYCFLHTDYDTNPPPRRGGSGSTPRKEKIVSSTSESDIAGCPPIPDLSHVVEMHSWKPSISRGPGEMFSAVAPDDSCSSSSSRSDTEISKPSSQLIMCLYPLLGSISSDQWLDKCVLIGLGPFVNRIGRIVKWGNGWVSVRIKSDSSQGPEDLLHNRRSVELFLLPSDEQEACKENERNKLVVDDSPQSHHIAQCIPKEVGEAAEPDTIGSAEKLLHLNGNEGTCVNNIIHCSDNCKDPNSSKCASLTPQAGDKRGTSAAFCKRGGDVELCMD